MFHYFQVMIKGIIPIILLCGFQFVASGQQEKPWHGIERELRYRPEGKDIVIENGTKKFNRALYGGNTAFRAEAGDKPEFALYMPGMGGNIQFGITIDKKSKWLSEANYIKAIYRAGSMIYEIKDSLLKEGTIFITAIASYDADAIVINLSGSNLPFGTLTVMYGGASGKRFSRDGDIGADPESSFYLTPESCKGNKYQIFNNSFTLAFENRKISGVFPGGMKIVQGSAQSIQTPQSIQPSADTSAPLVFANKLLLPQENMYIIIGKAEGPALDYAKIKTIFNKTTEKRKQLADRIKLETPDPFINALDGVLSIAADAIWESPSFMHGAVAWRMRLNGWRGAYAADVLGWHDRAKQHFNGYAASQLKAKANSGVLMDTALHLARHLEKIGTALFSSGYICRNPNDTTRAHHYDMNLVFVDQLLNHFNWTGDTVYVKKMWPLLVRHLEWEKRNFDADGDGLYDAYAAIWASDALQYSGGGVTHSSAYNYRANKVAAELAKIIKVDGTKYLNEANKIYQAIQKQLWLPQQGSYGEYKDLLGKQLVHSSPGLWTIYHAIDSKVPDPFQSYQNLKYIDNHIPHIPIKAKGLKDSDLYTLSTSNWQPYTWSLNNVALAELMHTALAYWQGGLKEEAYKLWRSSLIESMYLGSSPGNIQQLSFYDAVRGELYRDFADPIGMAARSLVEGLFGIQPDALNGSLTIKPGFPSSWASASLEIPDISIQFNRARAKDAYTIKQSFPRKLRLKLILPLFTDEVAGISVDGKSVNWKVLKETVGHPLLEIDAGIASQYLIEINWKGRYIESNISRQVKANSSVKLSIQGKQFLELYDPQEVFIKKTTTSGEQFGTVGDYKDNKTYFVRVNQGIAEWWQPVNVSFMPVAPARNTARSSDNVSYTKIDLKPFLNEKVTNIFKQQYLSPRPKSPTLQLPTQGIGNWAYPLTEANINDSGLRKNASSSNEIKTSSGILFATPSDTLMNNIAFVSQWDNFPDSISIPLNGSASRLHLLMAGSTNPMQSWVTNGMIVVRYKDGSSDTLLLENPTNWWPIEQDYYVDGFAFTASNGEMPERLYLKEGKFGRGLSNYSSIRGFSNRAIDGGAATVLNMDLDSNKELASLSVYAIANDVVIGLMSLTLDKGK